MIVYENAPEPTVRVGQFDLAGRRVAAHAIAYAGETGLPPWRFDPLERRFVARAPRGSVSVGPFDAEAWQRALAKSLAGAVAVGPCDPSEEIRGAYRAAAEGATRSGRGVFLLDPDPAALPESPAASFVALFVALPGVPVSEGLAHALHRGFTAGSLVPLIPGWSAEPDALEETVAAAAAAGARFVAGIAPSDDGPDRRSIVEARSEIDGQAPEDFFERVHHGDWGAAIERARTRLREACAARGLAFLPPRPAGRLEPPANVSAAGRLEEKAEEVFGQDEHRASLLHAAARWIDESGRDLGLILREGNFRKIFPFGDDLSSEAEEALRGGA